MERHRSSFIIKTQFLDCAISLKVTDESKNESVPTYYFDIYLVNGTKIGNCFLRLGNNELTRIGGTLLSKINVPENSETKNTINQPLNLHVLYL